MGYSKFLQRLDLIKQRRKHSQPLPRGAAPYTSSNDFRTESSDMKAAAKSWNHRFSESSQLQTDSPLKTASRGCDPQHIITLGTARPSAEFFPWESLQMRCLQPADSRIQELVSMGCTKGEAEYDLSVAMNYGYSAGSPQVLRFVTEHVEMVHNPPYKDWESCLTCGTTSALEICFRIFCNPGDTILMKEFTYPGTISAAKAQGMKILGINIDSLGLTPEDLDHKLNNWDPALGPKPFLLYMIPTGQNPSGTTQSLERRKSIYQVAIRHDLYIIEDDPYYFHHLGPRNTNCVSTTHQQQLELEKYLKKLPPSYLSLDSHGRVLRLDTTSKILAPGLRCGWITASSQVIRKFLTYSEVSVLSPSGPSQVMLHKLLDETWGHEGLIQWLLSLSLQYSERRDLMVQACERFIPAKLCSWEVPINGMFLWFRVHVSQSSQFPNRNLEKDSCDRLIQLEEMIFDQACRNGVLVSKGSWFVSSLEEVHGVNFRVTFAAAPTDELTDAIQRFGEALSHVLSKVSSSEDR